MEEGEAGKKKYKSYFFILWGWMSVSLLLRYLRDRACLRKIPRQKETVQIGFHSNFSTKSNGSIQPRGESRKTIICSKQTLSWLNLFLKYLTLCNLLAAHIITLTRRECFLRIPFLRNSWNIELYCDNIMTYCTLLKEKSIKCYDMSLREPSSRI